MTQREMNSKEYRTRYKSKVKTQNEMIAEYLDMYGSITPLEALDAIGCFRLGARICDLRKKGFNITTTIASGDKQFAIYTLINS